MQGTVSINSHTHNGSFLQKPLKLCVKEQFLSLVSTVTREFDIGYLSVRLSVCPMLYYCVYTNAHNVKLFSPCNRSILVFEQSTVQHFEVNTLTGDAEVRPSENVNENSQKACVLAKY